MSRTRQDLITQRPREIRPYKASASHEPCVLCVSSRRLLDAPQYSTLPLLSPYIASTISFCFINSQKLWAVTQVYASFMSESDLVPCSLGCGKSCDPRGIRSHEKFCSRNRAVEAAQSEYMRQFHEAATTSVFLIFLLGLPSLNSYFTVARST